MSRKYSQGLICTAFRIYIDKIITLFISFPVLIPYLQSFSLLKSLLLMFKFESSKLQKKEKLGTGSFGSVYVYNDNETNKTPKVVKVMLAKGFPTFIKLFQEALLGFSLSHPAVLPVKAFHCEQLPPLNPEKRNEIPRFNIYLLLPRLDKNLEKLLDEHSSKAEKFSEDQILQHFYQLICGVKYLHSKRIIHRDIKPANVLVNSNGKLVLADIGIAKLSREGETLLIDNDNTGTGNYSAPEAALGLDLTNKDLFLTDLWSLGVVILELCLLRKNIITKKQLVKEAKVTIDNLLEELKGKYSQELIDLVGILVNLNPEKRRTALEIKKILEDILHINAV